MCLYLVTSYDHLRHLRLFFGFIRQPFFSSLTMIPQQRQRRSSRKKLARIALSLHRNSSDVNWGIVHVYCTYHSVSLSPIVSCSSDDHVVSRAAIAAVTAVNILVSAAASLKIVSFDLQSLINHSWRSLLTELDPRTFVSSSNLIPRVMSCVV